MLATKIEIRERGATPRKMRKVMNAAMKETWFETGAFFHSEMSDDRFTHRHATLAGYAPRTKKYTSTKLKKFGHTNPLEFTGRTRRLSRTASITSTSHTVSIRYPGTNTLNFRNPKARNPINLAEEFRRITKPETERLASEYDRKIEQKLAANQETTVTKT
jgi:hypothetical protein